MGIAHTRYIYDEYERFLDLQPIAKRYGNRISDWYRDSNNRLVCRESVDLIGSKYADPDFKSLYKELNGFGLQGITKGYDKEDEIYSFRNKW